MKEALKYSICNQCTVNDNCKLADYIRKQEIVVSVCNKFNRKPKFESKIMFGKMWQEG